MNLPLVVHERLGNWARQLRPRLAAWPVRLVESRSTADLLDVLGGTACPIVVIDLARQLKPGLEALDLALQASSQAMVLVLDAEAHDGVEILARELGATHVLSGPFTPPAVARLIERWIPIALRRTEQDGWSSARKPSPEPEPWNWLAPYLTPTAARNPRP